MSKQIIERDVLASLLTDKSRIDQVQDIIKSEHFSSPYLKWAYEKLLAYYEKYCDVPKVSYFKI